MPRPPTPDTSAGYIAGDVRFCPSTWTMIVPNSRTTAKFECVLAVGHQGSHRDAGVHWDSTEAAPVVEEA